MDMFKTNTAASANKQNNNQQQDNKMNGKDNLSATNPTVDPATGKMPTSKPSDENPLDVYTKLYDNANKATPNEPPSFNLDPKVVADVASKMDFTRGVDPELVQKATNGDAGAMMQLIQEVGRNSYRASLEHVTKLTDTHLGQRAEYDTKKVQSGIKSQLTSDALSSLPNYNHPVIKAELNRIANQFANSQEYADATPSQIAEAAKRYLNDIHAAMNPANKTVAQQQEEEGMDWTKYLTS
jgi:hypothetical protein